MKCCQFVLKILFVLLISAFSVNIMAGFISAQATISLNSNAAEPSTNGSFTISIDREPFVGGSFFVEYSPAGGSATPEIDFVALGKEGNDEDAGVVEFVPGGPLSIQVPLIVIDDPDNEGNETVVIVISDTFHVGTVSDNINIGSPSQITMNIQDDDNIGTITVEKDFVDDNPDTVQVTLVCVGATIVGPPTRSASERSPAVYNLINVFFDNVCTATETVPFGYTPDESDCSGESVEPGGASSCTITNTPITGTITVFKDFSDDSDASVPVTLTCTDASIDSSTKSAAHGRPAVFNLSSIGEGNECSASETVPDGYTADQSRCSGLSIEAGSNFCTIINTRVEAPGEALFTVHKDFSDNSTAAVQITLTCTDATIDQASKPASEAAAAEFILSDVVAGNVCTATETVPEGYIAEQSDCAGKATEPGSAISCQISNTLEPDGATFTVLKDFTDDSTASVQVSLTCTDASIDQAMKQASEANAAVFNLSDVASGNVCTATEMVPEGYTAVQSDCAAQAAGPESSNSCQITNTPIPGTTFTVNKVFSPALDDDDDVEVVITLTCTGAVIDEASKTTSEASSAVFNLSDVTEDNSCTATEAVPEGYIPDETKCANVAAPPGSSASCTITNNQDTATPENPFPDDTLDPNQIEIGGVVFDTCISNPTQGGNAADFQALCSGLVGSQFNPGTSDDDVEAALKQVTPDDAAAVRSSGMQTSNVQAAAVGGRLGTLRGGGGAGFSASGFNMKYGDLALSGGLLKSFISAFDQNNPAFMQLNATQSDDATTLDEFGRWGAWISGRVIFGEKDQSTNQIEYDFDTAGLTMGLDYRFTEEFVAGLAVGYANTDADMGVNDGKIETKGYTVSIYGTWFKSDRFYLGGSVGYGSNDYDQLRNVSYSLPGNNSATAIFKVDQSLMADYDGNQLSFALDGGWDFNKNGWTYGPTFRVNYVDVDVDAFDEILLSSDIPPGLVTVGWAVHIDDQSYKSLQPAIGFEFSKAISKDWGVFIPQGYIEVVSELEDGGALITGNFLGDLNKQGSFTLLTDDFEETFARAGLGFGMVLKNNKSAFLMLDADLGRDLLQTYYVNAGFRWQF